MTDLFGTPEGKRQDREEWRLVLCSLTGDKYRPHPSPESAARSAQQFRIPTRIEHRTVTTYTTPWSEA